jgi:hypothetical protein
MVVLVAGLVALTVLAARTSKRRITEPVVP